tara:strand:- start:764 stop:1792 length:1029 start_codon:yes stop_codon:yes gene_type:complete
MKKRLVFDQRTTTLLGPSSKLFESLKDIQDRGYKVDFILKDWSLELKTKSNKPLLWDPNLHPKDIILNLIKPTFNNIRFVEKENSYKEKLRILVPPFFNRSRFVHYDFVSQFLDRTSIKNLKKDEMHKFLNNPKFITFVRFVLFFLYINFFRNFKLKFKSKGFRYVLSKNLSTKKVDEFIERNRDPKVKNILISVLWDESMRFENQEDRLKGGPKYQINHDEEFENLKSYIKELDNFAIETGKIRFVLASKKAVDWENFIQSDFVDLRNFEDLGFTMSQSIFIAQELTDVSINWPSTYSIWITNCKNILHLTWLDNKDTAKWARNRYHKKPSRFLLKKLNVY